jgi:hypothetical protein
VQEQEQQHSLGERCSVIPNGNVYRSNGDKSKSELYDHSFGKEYV